VAGGRGAALSLAPASPRPRAGHQFIRSLISPAAVAWLARFRLKSAPRPTRIPARRCRNSDERWNEDDRPGLCSTSDCRSVQVRGRCAAEEPASPGGAVRGGHGASPADSPMHITGKPHVARGQLPLDLRAVSHSSPARHDGRPPPRRRYVCFNLISRAGRLNASIQSAIDCRVMRPPSMSIMALVTRPLTPVRRARISARINGMLQDDGQK
jgi:hypothetical protein